MTSKEQSPKAGAALVAPTAASPVSAPRRPYAPPIIDSGDAFERVQLQSGGGSIDPIDCPP